MSKPQFPKTHFEYWKPRLVKLIRGGTEAKFYSAQIQHGGKRRAINLKTANREDGAKKAAAIYKKLLAGGWEAYDGKPTGKTEPTVGQFFAEARNGTTADPKTFEDYVRVFRRIVADIEGVDSSYTVTRNRVIDGKKVPVTETKDARYDYRGDHGKKWRAKVDRVKLAKITPAKTRKWIRDYVDPEANPKEQKSQKTSANSNLRQAKALFSADIVEHFKTSGYVLPDPLPFDKVKGYGRQSTRYRSRIDAGALIRAAVDELSEAHPPAFLAFTLAAAAGLRRGEIDSLMWSQVDLKDGVIHIEATEWFHPKTEDSIGDVEIDEDTTALLRQFREKSRGQFVLESDRSPRPASTYASPRCEETFKELYAWLRSHGVTAQKPLHELRKECGSYIAETFGIYAASRFLRHADVSTTAAHYLDKKSRVTFGMGAALAGEPENVTSIKEGTR